MKIQRRILFVLAVANALSVAPAPRPATALRAVDGDLIGYAVGAAALGAAALALGQRQEESTTGAPAPSPIAAMFAPKKKKAEIAACWSGDSFGKSAWPASPSKPPKRKPAVAFERAAWSGSPYASNVRAAAAAAAAAAVAVRTEERRAELARLGIVTSPALRMERAAWSGSPYASPARASLKKPGFFDALFGMFKSSSPTPKPAAAARPASPVPAGATASLTAAEAPKTAAEWRAACDAGGVASYADFGIAL